MGGRSYCCYRRIDCGGCCRFEYNIDQVFLMVDRVFTTKLGLFQSLMVQGGTHNLNVTLKGYSKKFWGLLGQKAHKTQLITLDHPQRRFILNLMSHRQTYNPTCKPKQLPNRPLSFIGIIAHSAHNITKFSDSVILQNQVFALVVMLTLITQSL